MYDVIIFTENTDPMQIAIPLGAFKVASVLRKNDYSTLVVNHLSTFTIEELKKLLDSAIGDNTKLVGFSTTFMRSVKEADGKKVYAMLGTDTVFPQGKEFEDVIIAYIKSKNKNIKIIAGGGRVSETYYNSNIDYVFMGYSESSIIDLMDHLLLDKELPNSTVNEFGITVVDDRKAPRYDFTKDSMVWEKTDVVNHKVLPIEVGRGCIFKCKFCSFPLNGKKRLDYIKEAEIIYQELLDNYVKFGVEHYFIVDDTFNDHILKLKAIEEVVSRLPFQPKFWCYTRLDLLCTNPEMVPTMYNLGVRGMFFGIETLHKESGLIIGKGYDRNKQISMIKHIRETYPDISMHGSFIAGLPKEPLDSIKLTCDQLRNGEILLHSWNVQPLCIFSKTALSFNSDITLYPEHYGYTIKGEVPSNAGILFWENEHTSFEEVIKIASECVTTSRTKDYFKVPSHDSFELVNYGYDLKTTMSTSHKDFGWQKVEDIQVEHFIDDYKQQLFDILDAQVVELVDTQR